MVAVSTPATSDVARPSALRCAKMDPALSCPMRCAKYSSGVSRYCPTVDGTGHVMLSTLTFFSGFTNTSCPAASSPNGNPASTYDRRGVTSGRSGNAAQLRSTYDCRSSSD